MADISKIRLENETYNIKDETARNNIAILNRLLNKKIVIIGDSYSVTDNQPSQWINKFQELTGISDITTNAKGGVGFCNVVDGTNFNMLLNNVTSSDDVTDIGVVNTVKHQIDDLADDKHTDHGIHGAVILFENDRVGKDNRHIHDQNQCAEVDLSEAASQKLCNNVHPACCSADIIDQAEPKTLDDAADDTAEQRI